MSALLPTQITSTAFRPLRFCHTGAGAGAGLVEVAGEGAQEVLPPDGREVPLARVVEVDGAERAARGRRADLRADAPVPVPINTILYFGAALLLLRLNLTI